MKKLFLLLFLFFNIISTGYAENEVFDTPVPSEFDEVTKSGPDTKFSLSTQMRFDSFQDAEINADTSILEGKTNVPLYVPVENKNYLQRVKIKKAKIKEYTNGSYEIRYKDTPNTIFYYNKDGSISSFAIYTDKKIPYTKYHYNLDGVIQEIEIVPDYYRSYVYGLDGVLLRYSVDGKYYLPNGKMIQKTKKLSSLLYI